VSSSKESDQTRDTHSLEVSVKREEQMRTPKETERARGTHFLKSAEGETSRYHPTTDVNGSQKKRKDKSRHGKEASNLLARNQRHSRPVQSPEEGTNQKTKIKRASESAHVLKDT